MWIFESIPILPAISSLRGTTCVVAMFSSMLITAGVSLEICCLIERFDSFDTNVLTENDHICNYHETNIQLNNSNNEISLMTNENIWYKFTKCFMLS